MAAGLTVRSVTDAQPAVAPAPAQATRPGHVRKTGDAAQKFEAFVLQSFIQDMMPKTSEGVFGSGIAGDFWKSMMAEKVAEQVAERGSIGIADYVRAGHTVSARPHQTSSADVLSHLSTMNNGLDEQLGIMPTIGE